MLACYLGARLGGGMIHSLWMDWVAHLFGPTVRGTAMGASISCSALAGVAAAALAAGIIVWIPGTPGFITLFLTAGVIGLVGMVVFTAIDDPGTRQDELSSRVSLIELLRHCGDSLRDANFRAFMVGRLLASSGFCIVPFITLHYKSAAGGGLSDQTVIGLGGAVSAGYALASVVVGRIGDKRGHRLGAMIGVNTQIVALVIMLTVGGWIGCLLAFLGAGIGLSTAFVAESNLLFETCRHAHRPAHIALGNLIVGSGTVVAGLLAGVIVWATSTRMLFGVCLALSAAALAWFAFKVREPRTLHVWAC